MAQASNTSAILMIAGFGDNAGMFDGLRTTRLADQYQLVPLNLPGFGAPALQTETTLDALGSFVAKCAEEIEADIILAHSVASIIACLAAGRPGTPLKTLLSLEGNLTADDAYFSGTAADFADPDSFRAAFLKRLKEMGKSNPILNRYHDATTSADPMALWQLGCDARRISASTIPGEMFDAFDSAVYFFNPDNCPTSSLEWLEKNELSAVRLPGASHWASIDQPEVLSEAILDALYDAVV